MLDSVNRLVLMALVVVLYARLYQAEHYDSDKFFMIVWIVAILIIASIDIVRMLI